MNIYFSVPNETRKNSLHQMMKCRTFSKTGSPFQIKEIIPSGGIHVSVGTHRFIFHVNIHLEIETRRKL